MQDLLLGSFAILGYLATAFWLVHEALHPGTKHRRLALLPACLATTAHALLLFLPQLQGQVPDLHFFRALSLVAWAMVLVVLLAVRNQRTQILLVVILPIAALASLLHLFAPAQSGAAGGVDWQIRLHVVIAMSAYALLSIAALQALLFAWQDRLLRERRLGLALRAMPPLAAMEALLFQFIAGGFALLTLTILSGALFIHDWMAQHLVHKTVLTLAAWLLFGILLYGHYRHGWRGRRAVRWTLGGMGVLLLAFFGSKFVLEVLLQRG